MRGRRTLTLLTGLRLFIPTPSPQPLATCQRLPKALPRTLTFKIQNPELQYAKGKREKHSPKLSVKGRVPSQLTDARTMN
jgi:hypothetical protein